MNIIQSIKKSFPALEKLLTEDDIRLLRRTPPEDLWTHHRRLGYAVQRLLCEDSSLLLDLLENGVADPDEMTALILLAYQYFHSRIPPAKPARNLS